MTALPPDPQGRRRALEALAEGLRPELHHYAARLVGSAIDGEDVVQDAVERALVAVDDLPEATLLRPWLFRIVHNRAIDLMRRVARHRLAPIETAMHVPDRVVPDAEEAFMRREAVGLALARWAELAVPQRSAVILKDVLGESLADIADFLGISIDAVKAHLARGRARLRALAALPPPVAPPHPIAPETQAFAELFNRQDWAALRGLLAQDARLVQSGRPPRLGGGGGGSVLHLLRGLRAHAP